MKLVMPWVIGVISDGATSSSKMELMKVDFPQLNEPTTATFKFSSGISWKLLEVADEVRMLSSFFFCSSINSASNRIVFSSTLYAVAMSSPAGISSASEEGVGCAS